MFPRSPNITRFALIPALVIAEGFLRALPLLSSSPCDPSLRQARENPLGYRDRGDRCEGVYIRDVGSTTLLVASLTESFEEYDPASARELQVRWDAVPGKGSVRLRAQGLRRHLYYRMDTIQPADRTSYSWPTDVLASLNLLRKDVGLVGVAHYAVADVERDVYLPLRIGSAEKRTRPEKYVLTLLPGVELSEVFVSVSSAGADGRLTVIRDGEKLGYGYYPADRGIEIPISGLKGKGTYSVEIGAQLRGGGTSTIGFWFYHPTD